MADDHHIGTNSLPENHHNQLRPCMLRQICKSLEANFTTQNYCDSSDPFEFLTMLFRCNFYKIADLDFTFSRESPQCQTIDYLIHLLRTISG